MALALVGLGAWLRLRSLSEMEFKGDEMRALQLGMQLLSEQPWLSPAAWPTHGMPSSNGIGNAPLFSWLVAGAWALSPDPIGVARMIALVNVACLYPLYRWCRRHLSAETSLIVLAIMAVSPFTVMFSRKIWGQDLLCIGVVLAMWAIEWLRSSRPWRGAILLLLAIVFLGQLHQSGPIALAVLPVALACQFLIDRRTGWTWSAWRQPSGVELAALISAAALVLFFWIPYLGYLADVPLKTLAERPMLPGRRYALQLFWRVVDQVRPADLLHFFEPDQDDFWADTFRRRAFDACTWLGTPLAIYGVWRWLRKPRALPVVGIWWIAIIAAFALTLIPTHPFYVLALMPLPALLAGGAFDGPMPRAFRTALRAARIAYVVALAALTIGFQNWLFARGGTHVDAYGVAYSIRVAQARAIAERLSATSRGTADREVAGTLECDELPIELIWLVQRVVPEAPQTLEKRPQLICDGFTGPAGVRRYRWMLKPG